MFIRLGHICNYSECNNMSDIAENLPNLRKYIRCDANLNGQVYFDGTILSDCVIKNISETGMLLFMPRLAWLPVYFEISCNVFPGPIQVKKIWSRSDSVGVEIINNKSETC